MSESLSLLKLAIRNGHLDGELDMIQKLIVNRKKVLGRKLHDKEELKLGDHVRIQPTVSPRYLAGLTATITKIQRTRVTLEFHSGQDLGRFTGRTTTCPISLIELIGQQPLNTLRKRKRRSLGD